METKAPQAPPPVRPRLGQFDIVEEYTIDDNAGTSSGSSVEMSASTSINVTAVGQHPPTVAPAKVETVPSLSLPSSDTKTMLLPSSSVSAMPITHAAKPQVVYLRDITDFYVETTRERVKTESISNHVEDTSQGTYPWKKKLIIRLKRLSDFDINLWCKTPCDTVANNTLHVETLSVKQETDVQMPTVVQVKGYGLHAGSKRKRSHVESDQESMTTPNSSTVTLNRRLNCLHEQTN